jgi:hypothetical protein
VPWKVIHLDVTCAQFVDMCALEKLFLVSDNSEAQLRKMHFFFGKRSEFRGKVTCPKGESAGFIGTQRNSIGISKAVP